MLLATMLMAGADTQAKFLTSNIDPIQIAWSRQAVLFLGAIVYVAIRGTRLIKSTRFPVLQFTRGCLSSASAIIYISALAYVQLTEAIAITFTAPFFILVLARVFLGEKISSWQWMAIIIGFSGVVFIAKPHKFLPVIPFVMLLIEALLFAIRQIVTKKVTSLDSIETTAIITALTSGAVLFIPMMFVFRVPTMVDFSISLLIGLLAGLAEILMIKALSSTNVSNLAPIHYTLLLWGGIFSWFLLNEIPDLWTVFGSLLIVISGIYLVYLKAPARHKHKV